MSTSSILRSTLINVVNPRLRRYTNSGLIASIIFAGMSGGTVYLFFIHSSGCSDEVTSRFVDVKDSWPGEHGYRIQEFYSDELNTPAILSKEIGTSGPKQEYAMHTGTGGAPSGRLTSPTLVRSIHVCISGTPHEIIAKNHHDYCTSETDNTCAVSILSKSYCHLDMALLRAQAAAAGQGEPGGDGRGIAAILRMTANDTSPWLPSYLADKAVNNGWCTTTLANEGWALESIKRSACFATCSSNCGVVCGQGTFRTLCGDPNGDMYTKDLLGCVGCPPSSDEHFQTPYNALPVQVGIQYEVLTHTLTCPSYVASFGVALGFTGLIEMLFTLLVVGIFLVVGVSRDTEGSGISKVKSALTAATEGQRDEEMLELERKMAELKQALAQQSRAQKV